MVEEKIDLNYYVEYSDTPKEYKLIGIVSIYKDEKKYASFSMSNIDKNWYLYNDETVTEMELKKILEIYNSFLFIPCILIYENLNIEENKK